MTRASSLASSLAHSRTRTRARARGFNLVSVMLAVVIVGVAVPAVVSLAVACTQSNGQSARYTQAVTLANNLQEMALLMPVKDRNGIFLRQSGQTSPEQFTNVYALDGWTASPPVDSAGRAVPGLSGWEQRCTVSAFNVLEPGVAVPPANDNARLVTVEVAYRGSVVYRASRVLAPSAGVNP